MQAFEWNEEKARANQRKHGISFDEALQVFFDDSILVEEDRIVGDEQRWTGIGMIGSAAVLIVAHTVRNQGDGEIVRIISARKANAKEKKRYGQNRSKDI